MHPIHKHGSGMRSAERYDAKEAYNKKLSSKARMHYLENDIADHKGMSMYKDKGMSRYGSSDSPAELTAEGKSKIMASDANQSFKDAIAKAPLSRESVKQERINLNTENPIKKASCKYKK
jgi:hypothetical protein